jgi:DNA polymerase III epsilon subunit-like protein
MTLWHALDTETNGFGDKADIAEIAILTYNGTQLIDIFHQYYSVPFMSEGAQKVNGYTVEQLAGWKAFKDPENIKKLSNILKYKLFIHNAPFDTGFLDRAGVIYNKALVKDTLSLCKQGPTKLENNKLTTWLDFYGLNSSSKSHGALGDAFGLSRLVITKGWYIL